MSLKRILLLVPALLLFTGCATSQTNLDPIKEQIAGLEERVSTLESRVDALETQNTEWKESLDSISRAAEDAEMLKEMTQRAEDAANKAERAFEHMQRKGH